MLPLAKPLFSPMCPLSACAFPPLRASRRQGNVAGLRAAVRCEHDGLAGDGVPPPARQDMAGQDQVRHGSARHRYSTLLCEGTFKNGSQRSGMISQMPLDPYLCVLLTVGSTPQSGSCELCLKVSPHAAALTPVSCRLLCSLHLLLYPRQCSCPSMRPRPEAPGTPSGTSSSSTPCTRSRTGRPRRLPRRSPQPRKRRARRKRRCLGCACACSVRRARSRTWRASRLGPHRAPTGASSGLAGQLLTIALALALASSLNLAFSFQLFDKLLIPVLDLKVLCT